MNKRNSVMLAVACVGVLGGGAALARSSEHAQQGKASEQILVHAPRKILHQMLPQGQGEKDTYSTTVGYGDLDLKKETGAHELESRIRNAADLVCEKLATAYPSGTPSKDDCAAQATDKAMDDARAVIKAARAHGG
jgi:UrcA family protein